jgi:glycosyltransferase involved in cell wall biosynthesis
MLVTVRHLRFRYDVVQVHTMPDFMVFSGFLPRLMGAGLILDVHDLMPELYMSKFGLGRDHWLIQMIMRMETASVAFADRAISVHKTHLEALISHGCPPKSFEILLNVPDPSVFGGQERKAENRDRFKLVYHGTLSKRHGLELAVRAAAVAQKEIANLSLSIVGDGDDRERLERLAADLGLGNVVDFTKKAVPVTELPALLGDSSLGIVPFKNDSFTRYMLPVKLMEYVSLGIPVIVTRTRTIEEYFDDGMVEYISGESVEELVQSIIRLHDDPDRRARMACRAREFIVEHNWESQKVRYFDLVDSVADPGRRGRI